MRNAKESKLTTSLIRILVAATLTESNSTCRELSIRSMTSDQTYVLVNCCPSSTVSSSNPNHVRTGAITAIQKKQVGIIVIIDRRKLARIKRAFKRRKMMKELLQRSRELLDDGQDGEGTSRMLPYNLSFCQNCLRLVYECFIVARSHTIPRRKWQ